MQWDGLKISLIFFLSDIGYNSTVKAKFEQRGNEPLLHIVLHLGVDLSVYFGEVADISGVVGKNRVDCVRVALMGFNDCFIGEKFTHGRFPPWAGWRGQNECHLSTSVLGNISTSLLALSVYGNISNLSQECIPYF